MKLVHHLKSGTNEIPIDTAAALQPAAFSITVEEKGETAIPAFASWQLPSLHEKKYKDHTFELQIDAQEIDRIIEWLAWAKGQFRDPQLPSDAALVIGVD